MSVGLRVFRPRQRKSLVVSVDRTEYASQSGSGAPPLSPAPPPPRCPPPPGMGLICRARFWCGERVLMDEPCSSPKDRKTAAQTVVYQRLFVHNIAIKPRTLNQRVVACARKNVGDSF